MELGKLDSDFKAVPVLQTGVEEINVDEILVLEVFEAAFEDADFDVVRELVDILELLDFESVLLVLLFEDEVVFGKVEVSEEELVLAVETVFEEEAVLDRVLDFGDVELEETLEERVVLEDKDTLMEFEPRTRGDELLLFGDDLEVKLLDARADVECV
ncbi:hypothetical protein KCU93_g3718, partial [Aureobasidium melanogenum]